MNAVRLRRDACGPGDRGRHSRSRRPRTLQASFHASGALSRTERLLVLGRPLRPWALLRAAARWPCCGFLPPCPDPNARSGPFGSPPSRIAPPCLLASGPTIEPAPESDPDHNGRAGEKSTPAGPAALLALAIARSLVHPPSPATGSFAARGTAVLRATSHPRPPERPRGRSRRAQGLSRGPRGPHRGRGGSVPASPSGGGWPATGIVRPCPAPGGPRPSPRVPV